ncbi:MAG: helix-turn-helix domain-containing protein [Saprospiraceae bacterium]
MKNKFAILLYVIVGFAQSLSSQLSDAQLQAALAGQQCSLIARELDTMTLTTENMKFNAAICFYRNGRVDRALDIFRDIQKMNGERWKGAAFWEAKINATLHQDSNAVAELQSLPKGFLNYRMLTQPEFDEITLRSNSFAQLKQSLKPGINIWTGALTIIAVIGLLLGLIFLFGRSNFSTGEKWMSVVVLSISIILFSYLTMWTKYVIYFPYIRNTWPFLTLLIGPSMYFYIKATFREEYTTNSVLYHFIIPAVSFLCLLPAVVYDFGINISVHNDLSQLGSSSTLLTGQIVFYTIRIHFMTQNEWQVDANIKTWTRILSWGMKIYTLAFVSYFILVSASFFNPQWDYAISMVMALGILVIAYMGLIQKRVFSSEPIEAILSMQKYQSSSLTKAASETIKRRLERLLLEEEVFKENELRLDDLASYLDITRHQLSQVINEHYKVNFFELLNRYRVEYVKKVLIDPAYSQYTIIQIAYEAGFNNKASFNTYFKREMGMTPSAYRMKENSLVSGK